jgi:RecA-family ATPase
MAFAPIDFIIPGLIPAEGVTLICAKPKVGKSWLLLDMSLSATIARILLGSLKPTQGAVLYLALEDGPRRVQSRDGSAA